jgi:hypothetical protein
MTRASTSSRSSDLPRGRKEPSCRAFAFETISLGLRFAFWRTKFALFKRVFSEVVFDAGAVFFAVVFLGVAEVGKLLGHSSVRTKEMYAHLLDSTLGDLAAETDKARSASLVKSSKNSGLPVVMPSSRPNGASTDSSMIS